MDIKIPRVYLTLRCDLRCYFCSNGPKVARYEELGADEWIERIGQLAGDEVVFTGGEPTLHPFFWAIVQSCEKRMHIYSNFARPIEMPAGLDIHWRASCHAQTADDAQKWVRNVTAIHKLGYKMTLTTVYCPVDVLEVLRPHGIVVDPPQHRPLPIPGTVRCTLPRILIAPDGRRFHCVSKLVRRDPQGVVALEGPDTIICHDATRCVACDRIASERRAAE